MMMTIIVLEILMKVMMIINMTMKMIMIAIATATTLMITYTPVLTKSAPPPGLSVGTIR